MYLLSRFSRLAGKSSVIVASEARSILKKEVSGIQLPSPRHIEAAQIVLKEVTWNEEGDMSKKAPKDAGDIRNNIT